MNTNLSTIALRTVAATSIAVVALAGLTGSTTEAASAGAAVVECNGAYNTIEVTPRMVSDFPDRSQYVATRVWIATWTPAAERWVWSAKSWKIDSASASNNPMGTDISRLATQRFQADDGYHYVYVESYVWDGDSWEGHEGQYTSSYTLVTPSVSHEAATRTTSNYCQL